MNRAIEALLRALKRGWAWLQPHPVVGPAARFLRAHWMEAIAVIGIAGLVLGVNPARLAAVFRGVRWQLALLMIPVTIATYAARGTAWWISLRCIEERISWIRCVAIEFAGQVMIFLPMGDLARVAMVRRSDPGGQGPGKLAGTITFQELVYMSMLGLGVLPRVASRPDVAVLVVLMVLAHIGIFTVLLWRPAYAWALRTVERIRILRRFDKPLRNLQPTFVQLFTSWTLAPVLLLNVVATALTWLLFFLALHAIGLSSVSFIAAMFVLSLSYVLAGLSFIPGGLGAFEGLLTVLMVANGVPAASGAAAGLLYRGYNDGLMAGIGASIGLVARRGTQRSQRQTRRSTANRRQRNRRSKHAA